MVRLLWRRHARALSVCGILASVLVGGCADSQLHEAESNESSSNVVRCTEPRPRLCTLQYDPVCAELKDGTWQSYASACAACSDADVISYRAGACE